MGRLNPVHVAKELRTPDLSTAEPVVKLGFVMEASQIIWHADVRLRRNRQGPALMASRTHCAVDHMSHRKMRRTPNESHMFFIACQITRRGPGTD